jgi:hypothetical protein
MLCLEHDEIHSECPSNITGDGTNAWSLGTCIAPDNLGNLVGTGRFYGAGSFGTVGTNTVLLTSAGQADVFVAKFDPDGNLVDPAPMLAWSRQGSSLSLTWPGSGWLQTATSLNEGWTDLAAAMSPYPVTNLTLGNRLYRIRR